MRTVSQNVIVSGIQKKLNIKPELKFTFWHQNAQNFIIPQGLSKLFDPNDVYNGTAQRCIEPPSVGTGAANFIGTKFNALYCIVRFSIQVAAEITINDYLRISVARPRLTSISGGNLPPSPSGIIQQWNTKDWDVMFDKVYGYVCSANSMTPPRIWQFKIPLRETIGLSPSLTYPLWDRPPIIMWCAYNSNQLTSNQISVKFFYRDP